MQKAHDATYNNYWENLPSVQTPIIAAQLNRNEQTVDEIDDRVITLDTNKAEQSDLDDAVKSVTLTAGTFEIEHFDGTINTYDTDLDVIPKSYDFIDNPNDAHYKNLAITLANSSVDYADMTGVITENDFTTSGTINYAISTSGSISFDIADYSITDTKMQPNYLNDITAQAGIATNAATASANSKKDSEAWAVGTRDGVPVGPTDPTYNNNAQYYATHGAGSSLAGMTDVDVSTVSNGQIIRYNSSTTKWENADEITGLLPHLIILSETGSTVTVNKTGIPTIYATETSTGHYECDVPSFGTYTIDAILGGDDAQVSLNVDAVKVFTVDDSHFHADITVTYPTGATVSCAKTGEPTQYATSSPYTFVVHSLGEYTITGMRNGITEVQTVTITASEQVVNITLTILPDGSTITPTDDVQILLNCADIWDKSYTSIGEVLDDSTSLFEILTTDNSIDYLVRSTTYASSVTADSDAMSMIGSYDYCADTLLGDSTWATAIANSAYADSVLNANVPTMTSNTTPSGEAFASSSYVSSYPAWKAFDKDLTTFWLPSKDLTNQYVGYKFTRAIKCKVATLKQTNYTLTRSISSKIQGSNDGTTYTDISDAFAITSSNLNPTVVCDDSVAYKYLRFLAVDVYTVENNNPSMDELQFYGRENGGVQSWLRSGGITDKTYTTLAEVLADTTTLSALIASHDAVDYLVTAKAFIDGIVADATAMSYIGLNNYCANTLLDDADWCTAIANSTYIESVLNVKVPTMTSNNTPSGVVGYSSQNSSYPAYYAFDKRNNTLWNCANEGQTTGYIQYDFGKTIKVAYVEYTNIRDGDSATTNVSFKIQASLDGTSFTDVTDTIGGDAKTYTGDVATEYTSCNIVRLTGTSGRPYPLSIAELQFYGREDV